MLTITDVSFEIRTEETVLALSFEERYRLLVSRECFVFYFLSLLSFFRFVEVCVFAVGGFVFSFVSGSQVVMDQVELCMIIVA